MPTGEDLGVFLLTLRVAAVATALLIVPGVLAGFAIALPFALDSVGGFEQLLIGLPPHFGDFGYSAGPGSGWTLLFLTGPAFIVSPGLIQKAYGASSARAVRAGVALNAFALMAFAFLPVLLGMVARVALPVSPSTLGFSPSVAGALLATSRMSAR